MNDNDGWCLKYMVACSVFDDKPCQDEDAVMKTPTMEISNLETKNQELRSEILSKPNSYNFARSSKLLGDSLSFTALESEEGKFSSIPVGNNLENEKGFSGFPSRCLLESEEKLNFYYKFTVAGNRFLSNESEQVFSRTDLSDHLVPNNVLVNNLSCVLEDQKDSKNVVKEILHSTSCVFLREPLKDEYFCEENENNQICSFVKEELEIACVSPEKSGVLEPTFQNFHNKNKLSGSGCLNKKNKCQCIYCNENFKCYNDLSKHMKSSICSKSHSCGICRQSFTAIKHLKLHLIKHINEKPHSCDVSKKSFSLFLSLAYHSRTHNSKISVSCNACLQSFTSSNIVNHHQHKYLNKKCYICKASFSNYDELEQHLLMHRYNRPYSCDICKRMYLTPSSLKRHSLTHSNTRAYACKFCDKSFFYSYHLKEHTRIHTNERPYKCHICSKTFIQLNTMKSHIGTHSKRESHVCHLCKKSYSLPRYLRRHISTHN